MGKMKAWRKEAAKHNREASEERGERVRHQGRRNKGGLSVGYNGAGLSNRVIGLLKHLGMRFEAVV